MTKRSSQSRNADAAAPMKSGRKSMTNASAVTSSARASTLKSWLEWFESPVGKGALALGGAAISITSLVLSTGATRIVFLAPLAFGLVAALSWRQRHAALAMLSSAACVLSVVLAVRTYVAPQPVSFFYAGEVMDNSNMPYRELAGIPLTTDPSIGHIYRQILPVAQDGPIEVSCSKNGRYAGAAGNAPLQWAKITASEYETLWIPMPFVLAESPGKGLTVLPCDDWRWRLQKPW
jgi:hypothetical protein